MITYDRIGTLHSVQRDVYIGTACERRVVNKERDNLANCFGYDIAAASSNFSDHTGEGVMIISRSMNNKLFNTALTFFVCVVLAPLCNADAIPYLIAKQPAEVREAWKEVDSLIIENGQLESPIPDPYLARAELWTQAGSHEDAVADYVQAVQIMLSRDASLIEQSKVLRLLRQSLHNLSQMPRAVYPTHAVDAYQKGFELYHRHRHEEAAYYFAEATRLNPEDSVYRVMRALNYRELKRDGDASQQLASAAGILRHPSTGARESAVFHRRLERIQGDDRLWIMDGLVKAELSAADPNLEATRVLSSLNDSP